MVVRKIFCDVCEKEVAVSRSAVRRQVERKPDGGARRLFYVDISLKTATDVENRPDLCDDCFVQMVGDVSDKLLEKMEICKHL